VDFARHCPLFQFPLLMEDSPRSPDFGPLLTDISPLHHSRCHILCCAEATISLGDAPVDRDLKTVSHSDGHIDLVDSTHQFHLPVPKIFIVLCFCLGVIIASWPFGQGLSILGLRLKALPKDICQIPRGTISVTDFVGKNVCESGIFINPLQTKTFRELNVQ
jgi:hypothetical protein